MRILFLTACYLPTVNGVSYHISLTKSELEKRGHRITILAPKFKKDRPNVIEYPAVCTPFAPTYPIGIPTISQKDILDINPDVIHTHHPFLVGNLGIKLSTRLNRPLFFTAHTQYITYSNLHTPIFSPLISGHLVHLAKHCQKIICPSPESKQSFNQLGILNTKIIFNGIETDLFVPTKHHNPIPKILFVGRLEKEKNIDLLVQVIHELSRSNFPHQFRIVGSGSLMSKLKTLGQLDRKDLIQEYQNADLFFTPSTSEVMPLTVIEAMSCGTPIICINNAKLNSLVHPGINGIEINPNPKEIASQIIALLKNHSQLNKFSLNARQHALKFSIEKSVTNLLKTYQG